jgi:hypothetical protein
MPLWTTAEDMLGFESVPKRMICRIQVLRESVQYGKKKPPRADVRILEREEGKTKDETQRSLSSTYRHDGELDPFPSARDPFAFYKVSTSTRLWNKKINVGHHADMKKQTQKCR